MAVPEFPAGFEVAKEFPILKKWLFFNHAGVSPLPARAGTAIQRYAQMQEEDAYLTGKWYKQAEVTRAAAARLINAEAGELAFVKNTSEGMAFVANGLTWKAGEEVLSTGVEYPANVYPWMDVAQRFGVKHVMVPERKGRIEIEELLGAVTGATRMIALSHVEYASGYRNDLVAVGKFCRERGILFCVDGIQGCGAMPVDVRAMNIDFYASAGHKWLLGPEGLGFFFCRKELIGQMHPEVGAMNVINATNYGDYDFTLRPDAKRFECGGYNIAGVLGLGASLALLEEVGMSTIWGRVKGLTDLLVAGLREKGYEVVSPREREEECSGIVAFKSAVHDHTGIIQSLEQRRIILVERERRLRAAPHFYQDESHVRTLIDALPGN